VASAAASLIGINTPISLLAALTLTSAVRSVIASASASRSIVPARCTGNTATRQPSFSSRAIGSSTALGSVAIATS